MPAPAVPVITQPEKVATPELATLGLQPVPLIAPWVLPPFPAV